MTKENNNTQEASQNRWVAFGDLVGEKLNFNFASVGLIEEVSLDEIPNESLLILLQYGCRKLNDRVNSQAKDNPDTPRANLIEEAILALRNGQLGASRAGVVSQNAGLRDFIFRWLRASFGCSAKALAEYKSATPKKLLTELLSSKYTAEQIDKILEVLTQRYEESLKIDIELELN